MMSWIDKLLRRNRHVAPPLRVLPPFSFQRETESESETESAAETPSSRIALGTCDETTPLPEPSPVQASRSRPPVMSAAPPPRRNTRTAPPPIPSRRSPSPALPPPPVPQMYGEDESTIVEVAPGVQLRELYPDD